MREIQRITDLSCNSLPAALEQQCQNPRSFEMLIEHNRRQSCGIPIRLGTYESLIAEDDCLQMDRVLEEYLLPIGDGVEAKQSVTFMLLFYSTGEKALKHRQYVNGLVSMFAKYPLWAHLVAVDQITAESESWPSRAKVKKVFEEILSDILAMRQVLKTHLLAHRRRK